MRRYFILILIYACCTIKAQKKGFSFKLEDLPLIENVGNNDKQSWIIEQQNNFLSKNIFSSKIEIDLKKEINNFYIISFKLYLINISDTEVNGFNADIIFKSPFNEYLFYTNIDSYKNKEWIVDKWMFKVSEVKPSYWFESNEKREFQIKVNKNDLKGYDIHNLKTEIKFKKILFINDFLMEFNS